MKFRDWFILIFTFFVGILAGMYVYTISYQPLYENHETPYGEQDTSGLTITGTLFENKKVGDFIQPFFKISPDGTFEYFKGGTVDTKKQSGKLPDYIYIQISKEIENTDFTDVTRQTTDKNCISSVDKLEHSYMIIYNNIEYMFDSCKNKFSTDSELGVVLQNIWDYLAHPEDYPVSKSNEPVDNTKVTENKKSENHTYGLGSYFRNGFKKAGF